MTVKTKTKTGSPEPEETPEEAARRRRIEQTEMARRAALGKKIETR